MHTADKWQEYIEIAEARGMGYKNINILKTAQRKAGIAKFLSPKVINWVLSLVEQLDTSDNVQSQIYKALTHSLRLRKQQPAFSPEARQTVLGDHPQSFALLRECREQQILVLASFSPSPQRINISALLGHPLQADIKDLITEASYNTTMPAELAPFQTIWFELKTFS